MTHQQRVVCAFLSIAVLLCGCDAFATPISDAPRIPIGDAGAIDAASGSGGVGGTGGVGGFGGFGGDPDDAGSDDDGGERNCPPGPCDCEEKCSPS